MARWNTTNEAIRQENVLPVKLVNGKWKLAESVH